MRRALFIGCGLASLLLLAAIVFAARFDIDSWKSSIEAAVSEATGMEVTIEGKVALARWFPLDVVLHDVRFRIRGDAILDIETVELRSLEIASLIRKRVRVKACNLEGPAITVVKDEEGRFNFESGSEKAAPAVPGSGTPVFLASRLSVRRGRYSFASRMTGDHAEAVGIDSDLRDFAIDPAARGILGPFSFAGDVACDAVHRGTLTVTDLRSPVIATSGRFALDGATMDLLGGKGTGDIVVDMSGSTPRYEISLGVPQCRVERLLEEFGKKRLIGGDAALTMHLRAAGRNQHDLTKSLSGDVSLRGTDLTAFEMDVDRLIEKFEKTRRFSLIDLGAFFIAGPLGTVATKGYDFGRLYRETRTGHGTLARLVATWKIRDGVAQAEDCAFATHRNRVAFVGKIDLLSETYQDAVVAVLDERGCSRFSQRLSGPVASRQLITVRTMQRLAGPFVGLFRRVKKMLTADAKCEVFYDGSVPQPPESAR